MRPSISLVWTLVGSTFACRGDSVVLMVLSKICLLYQANSLERLSSGKRRKVYLYRENLVHHSMPVVSPFSPKVLSGPHTNVSYNIAWYQLTRQRNKG